MPQVSVIVPVYNVERYLSECLDSVRGQTLRDIEIICVNDGSTDRSGEILALYAAADERITIVDKPNGGLSSARNAGIRVATGAYLMFLDSDDYLRPNACEAVLNAFERAQADAVTFGGFCVPASAAYPWLEGALNPRDAVFEGFSTQLLFRESSRPFVWRTAVRRDFLLDVQLFFDEKLKYGEDQLFQFELYALAGKTVLLSDKLYGYRVVRKGSLMSTTADDMTIRVNRHLAVIEAILSAWERRGLLDLCPFEMVDWMLDFLFYDMIEMPVGRARTAAFARLGWIYERYLPQASELALKTSPVCQEIVDTSIALAHMCGGEGVASAMALRDEDVPEEALILCAGTFGDEFHKRYDRFRLGRKELTRRTLMRPLDVLRKRKQNDPRNRKAAYEGLEDENTAALPLETLLTPQFRAESGL